jgi:hypothetical protein
MLDLLFFPLQYSPHPGYRRFVTLSTCFSLPHCRWYNQLRPGVIHTALTPEEQSIIDDAVRTMGTKWARIVTMLPGRTDNAIKVKHVGLKHQGSLSLLWRVIHGGASMSNSSDEQVVVVPHA